MFGTNDPRLAARARRAAVANLARACESRQRAIRVPEIVMGDPGKPYVALTFDDGPHGDKTVELLDTLKRLRVPATFFLVGTKVRMYPELVDRMLLDGHELGNHTFHHYRLPSLPLSAVREEVNRTRELLRDLVGADIRLFRPPGGEMNEEIEDILRESDCVNVLWSDDPADYKPGRTPSHICQYILRDLTPGAIILLHSGLPLTVEALPHLVHFLRAEGLHFVTISDLVERGGGLEHIKIPGRISRTSAISEEAILPPSMRFVKTIDPSYRNDWLRPFGVQPELPRKGAIHGTPPRPSDRQPVRPGDPARRRPA